MSQLASYSFAIPDSSDIGPLWDPNASESNPNGFIILSNAALPSVDSQDSSETYNGVVWPNDHYSEVVFAQTGANGAGSGCGVTCREATGAATYYCLVGNASGYAFYKKIAGAFTSISTAGTTTFTAGDTMRLELQGTTWRIFKNTVQFATGTDSSIASGRAGIGFSSTDNQASLASWAGGNFGGGGGGSGFSIGDRTSGGMVDMAGGMYCQPDRVLMPKARRIFIPGMTRRAPRHPTLSPR